MESMSIMTYRAQQCSIQLLPDELMVAGNDKIGISNHGRIILFLSHQQYSTYRNPSGLLAKEVIEDIELIVRGCANSLIIGGIASKYINAHNDKALVATLQEQEQQSKQLIKKLRAKVNEQMGTIEDLRAETCNVRFNRYFDRCTDY